MKTEEKGNTPKARIAVIGKSNVGKSGMYSAPFYCYNLFGNNQATKLKKKIRMVSNQLIWDK